MFLFFSVKALVTVTEQKKFMLKAACCLMLPSTWTLSGSDSETKLFV